jgi:SAM-dependent methyltransferase
MTPARNAVNNAIAKLASEEPENTLFIGVDSKWDYRFLFKEYTTLDINPKTDPDIIADIQKCPEIKDNTYDAIIMTGVYEYLKSPDNAFDEIFRILKVGGKVLFCLPGDAYYSDKITFDLLDIGELEKFMIDEIRVVYYKTRVPYYFIIRARK